MPPMVILIASDQSRVRRGLADRLRELTGHRILTAATIAEMEAVPAAEGALDLLLFSPVFAIAGKEARVRLRERFPGVQTLALEEGLTLDQIVPLVLGWLDTGKDFSALDMSGEEMEVAHEPPDQEDVLISREKVEAFKGWLGR